MKETLADVPAEDPTLPAQRYRTSLHCILFLCSSFKNGIRNKKNAENTFKFHLVHAIFVDQTLQDLFEYTSIKVIFVYYST